MLTDKRIAMKEATRRAITLAGGPVNVAKQVRIRQQSHLSEYCNQHDSSFVPIDVAIEIDRLAGDNIILRAWADLHGFDLVARDRDADQLARDVTSLAGCVARESGELISSTIDAVSDGKLTPREAQKIHDEAADVIDLGVRLQERARQSMQVG